MIALCLSGSYGNNTQDEFSDFDFLALADPTHHDALVEAWKDAIENFEPIIYESRIPGPATLLNVITENWIRIDLLLTDANGLAHRAQDQIKVLIDRDNLVEALPQSTPFAGPNRFKIEYLVKEFIRILGLLPVGYGRNDIQVALLGNGLLRTHLIDLMKETVRLNDKGGALHLTKILDQEHLDTLAALSLPEANWDSIKTSQLELFRAFFPLARKLSEEAGVPWPTKFEEFTFAHIEKTMGLTFNS